MTANNGKQKSTQLQLLQKCAPYRAGEQGNQRATISRRSVNSKLQVYGILSTMTAMRTHLKYHTSPRWYFSKLPKCLESVKRS